MEEKISGIVEHIIYRNEENGYTVFAITKEQEELTCVGFFAHIEEGIGIEAEGRYTDHYSYGRQFKVENYSFRAPETAEAIEIYLGSGAVKGIGKALAARIVKHFGDDTLRIMEEEPERLAEIKGISLRKAREIAETLASMAGMRQAMMFLEGFGISLKMSIRIYRKYGEEIYEVLKTNPYRLADDIDGIGFLTADRIAARAGINAHSLHRIRSGILYTLSLAAGEGNVYLPEEELVCRSMELLSVERESVQEALADLSIDRRIILRQQENGGTGTRIVYYAQFYYLELGAARKLLELSRPMGPREEDVLADVDRLSKKSGIVLEEEQRRAVALAAMNGVVILTGGPGTGKTTTINEMIRYFSASDLSIMLAAPTGRAAKRMTETTGYEASTIHRLLEISSMSDGEMERVIFERNEDNPLEADVIIIDEMSMVDLFLFHSLLSAVAVGTRLILVGDVDQLPSVGAGAVLRDLLASRAFPSVYLNRIFRQAGSSDIVVNAHKINRGEDISLDNKSKDFFFLKRSDPNHIISNMILLVRDKLPSYVHAQPFDIQVLTPMRKGPLGVERLNAVLQSYLNPPDSHKQEKESGDKIFRVGDKVMQTRNNYELVWEVRGRNRILKASGSGIFNGDMGILRSIDEFGKYMEIEFDDGRMVDYPFGSLEDLEHAYAVTIHKSQGSEYPAVLLPLLGGPKMLMTRNLLYTAVTRARQCVIILGSSETVEAMIHNESELGRYTSLDLRILEMADPLPADGQEGRDL